MVASIDHGRVVDRLVPVDLTATACTRDLISARMDTVSDAMLERTIEERIASDARSAGFRASARSARQVDRTATAEREGQNRKDQRRQNYDCAVSRRMHTGFHHSPRKSWIA
jgi:hypothetical protein